MAEKTVSPGEEAKATPTPDDQLPLSGAAALFGQPTPEEPKVDTPKEPKEEEEPKEEQLTTEEEEPPQEEVFAEFGDRKFKDKDELLKWVKKVYGDNSRFVGKINDYEKQIEELRKAKEEPKVPEDPELVQARQRVETSKEEAKRALLELGFVSKDDIQPILEEKEKKQLDQLQAFVKDHEDFWDYEEKILAYDGKENPHTGRPYSYEEAYNIVKFLENPKSVGDYKDGYNEAKKQAAAKKQASMGTTKSASGAPEVSGTPDSLDGAIFSRF